MTEQIIWATTVGLSNDTIHSLVDSLASPDSAERHAAREQLEEVGEPAVPLLVKALRSPNENARWEAAKILGKIRDVSAAPALVRALDDEKAGVRWLASTALINLGRDALVPVLRGLEHNSDSIWFRDGAHHVLGALIRDGVADEAAPVLEALEYLVPRIEAPVAAYHVLEELSAI